MTILSRFTTAVADRYRIQRELGGSAVSITYRATQVAQGTDVTVRVVRPAIAVALDVDRFLRELKLASQLQHPYIVPLYEWGEADGFLYYVTPLVDADSLRDRLKRDKRLRLDDALQITREVATALNFAHSHQVVHRDIKPENVLLPAGTAIVSEFGIARAVIAAGAERIAPRGVGLGTPAYMSPEQVQGLAGTDGRSDIYSLACVLYEMLVGEPPFTGSTIERIIEQHRVADPPSVRGAHGVPDVVADALMKGLAKDPTERFNTAAQFVEALTGSGIPLAASGQEGDRDRPLGAGPWRWITVAVLLIGVAAVVIMLLG